MIIKGIEIQYGSNLNSHFKAKDTNDPNIPDRFESIKERTIISEFFNAGYNQFLIYWLFFGL